MFLKNWVTGLDFIEKFISYEFKRNITDKKRIVFAEYYIK